VCIIFFNSPRFDWRFEGGWFIALMGVDGPFYPSFFFPVKSCPAYYIDPLLRFRLSLIGAFFFLPIVSLFIFPPGDYISWEPTGLMFSKTTHRCFGHSTAFFDSLLF